jgi:secreted PhoX family phosphatase
MAQGYNVEILLRWGDKLTADTAEFDPSQPTAAARSRQFGYNNDFVGYFRCPWLERPSAACSASITNIETRMSCSRTSSQGQRKSRKLIQERPLRD